MSVKRDFENRGRDLRTADESGANTEDESSIIPYLARRP